MASPDLSITTPKIEDGATMWRIAEEVGLDPNSPYKYLIFCRDFADSCAIARSGDEVVGFVTGYRRPTSPGTLFVWQVGVLSSQRGKGVAGHMLDYLTGTGETADSAHQNPHVPRVTHLEATVTPDNEKSMKLFTGFGNRRGAQVQKTVLLPSNVFPEPHDEEILLRIGPF